MATTFSTNYQIKLIGDGEEDTTWGASTNKNLLLIEQMAGGGSVVQVESTTGWDSGSKTLTWLTSDTADAGTADSKGRSRFVKFTDGGSLTGGPIIINIRGSADAEKPERVFFVKNDLTTQVLELNNGSGANYSVANGAYAVVYCSGGTGGAVENVLNDLQVGGLNFEEAATIKIKDNVADALDITEGTNSYITIDTLDASTGRRVIIGSETTDLEEFVINTDLVNLSVQPTELRLKNGEALALKITDGSDNAIVVDSSNEKVIIGDSAGFTTLSIDTATVTVAAQATSLLLKDNTNAALNIMEGSNSYLEFDSQNGKPQVVIGGGTSDCDTLDIDTPTVDLSTQATDIDLLDNSAVALEFDSSDGTNILTLDTSNGSEKVVVPVALQVTGTLDVDGTSDFSATSNFSAAATFSTVDINGGAIDGTVIGNAVAAATTATTITGNTSVTTPIFNASGSTGYVAFGTLQSTMANNVGLRENLGLVQTRLKSDDNWGYPYYSGAVSGNGSYFESALLTVDEWDEADDIAHSLSRTPRLVNAVLQCQSASEGNGYDQYDEVIMSATNSSTSNRGIAAWAGPTYLGYKCGAEIELIQRDADNFYFIDQIKWRLIIRAWL